MTSHATFNSKIKCVTLLNAFFVFLTVLFSSSVHAYFSPETYEKALTSYHQGEYSTSIIHLKNILVQDNKHLPSRVLMAKNLLAQGKGSAAEIELNVAKKEGAALRLLAPLYAKAYLLQNKFDQVLTLPIARQTSDEYQSDMMVFIGLAHVGKNQLNKAIKYLDDALVLTPNNEDAYIGKAKVALKRHNLKEGIKLIDHVLSLNSSNNQALLMGGITYKQLKNNKAAYTYIERLLNIDPNNYSALLVRAVLLIDLQKYDLAIDDIDKIVEILPNEPIANYIKLLSAQASDKSQLSVDTQKHLETIMSAIPESAMDEQPVYYFLKGLINFQNNAMEMAEKSFVKYHKIYPNDIKVLKLLARTELALGNSYAGRKYLYKALLNDENDSDIWALLGLANMMTGNLKESEHYFNKVMEAYPDNLRPRIDLAKLLFVKGDYNQVISVLSEVLDEKSTITNHTSSNLNFELLVLLAKAYEKNKQAKQGLNISSILVKNYPNISRVNQVHATLLGLSGDLSQAKAFLDRAVELDGNNHQAVIRLARIDAFQGNINGAVTRLKHQLLKEKSSILMIELGDMYSFSKNDQESIFWYLKALSHNQSSVLALGKVVKKLEKNKEFKSALEIVNKYLDKHHENGEVHIMAANLYIQERQNEKALLEMSLAVKYAVNKSDALEKQAKMYVYLGEKAKAKNSLKHAISIDGSHLLSHQLLIQLYRQDNELSEGLALFNRSNQKTLPDYLINQLKGELYFNSNNQKSLSFYLTSYKQKSNKPALLGLYKFYNANKQYNEIESLLEGWLKDNPNDLDITLALGENYQNSQQIEKALSFYDKHIENNPQNVPLLNNGAMVNIAARKFEKAQRLAKRAHVLSPKSVNVIDTNAMVELNLGNLNKALSLLREANTLDYDNAEVKYHLAIVLDKLNRRKEAMNYLQDSVSSSVSFSGKAKAAALLANWLN